MRKPDRTTLLKCFWFGLIVGVAIWLCSITKEAYPADDQHHVEKFYQQKWCEEHHGRMEVVLRDGSRVDCVTDTHAIEFDFDKKWAESIGQALNYAMITGLRGGIVLIGPVDEIGVHRVIDVIDHYQLPLDIWTVDQ